MQDLDYAKVGARVRQVRKAKGWSQSQLAKESGISMSFLGHIERGTRIMSLETFISLCKALGTDADELLWGVLHPSGDGEGIVQDLWKQKEYKQGDHYDMYIQIMKSVAEIMGKA